MKTIRKNLLIACVIAVAVLAAASFLPVRQAERTPEPFLSGLVPAAQAATPNVAISNPGVMLVPLHISGQYTTTTASIARFNMPMPCDMLGVGASARAMGTTTMTVDVKSGGTTILSGPIAMVAGAFTEGTISTSAIPDENAITVDLNAPSGTSTIDDVVVLMTCIRK